MKLSRNMAELERDSKRRINPMGGDAGEGVARSTKPTRRIDRDPVLWTNQPTKDAPGQRTREIGGGDPRTEYSTTV